MKHCSGHTETQMIERRPEAPKEAVQWCQTPKKKRGEELVKNISVASALLVCMVMLRSGAIPQAQGMTDAVLAAVTDDSLLNDDLGKLSFVSTLFPEAVLVFGEGSLSTISMPVSASVEIHAWSEQEPYLAWTSDSTCVFAATTGVVAGVYHGMDEERIVQIVNDQQISCIVGNLVDVNVQTGDAVQKGDLIGWIEQGDCCTFEVQSDGYSIDPNTLLEAE